VSAGARAGHGRFGPPDTAGLEMESERVEATKGLQTMAPPSPTDVARLAVSWGQSLGRVRKGQAATGWSSAAMTQAPPRSATVSKPWRRYRWTAGLSGITLRLICS
jgi:hypothetical protein